ncbi:hypothetical protein D5086_033731 [Populus alba]|uniref:Uncharacterized protein n=1 Tax=Populus alba TaxID=43335 RepID=A0ACC4AHP8_POPAL
MPVGTKPQARITQKGVVWISMVTKELKRHKNTFLSTVSLRISTSRFLRTIAGHGDSKPFSDNKLVHRRPMTLGLNIGGWDANAARRPPPPPPEAKLNSNKNEPSE